MRFIATSAIGILLSLGSASEAQTHEEPFSQHSVQLVYDGPYGWGQYHNLSGRPIHLIFIFRPTDRRGLDLRGETPGNTGLSRKEFAQKGDPSLFICPFGTHAVDTVGKLVTFNVKEYRCKR